MEFLISSLTHYKYLILFPLSIVEGPILAMIAGFLCTNGILDLFYVFPILVVGDALGDSFYYGLGRWGQLPIIKKVINRFALESERFDRISAFFNESPFRIILLSKIVIGVGIVGLVLAGNAKLPYRKFIKVCLTVTLAQSALYVGIGLVFGQAFIQINRYLNWFIAFGLITFLATLVVFGIRSIAKKL